MAASKKGRELDEGEVLKIRVTFTDDILGTNPASPEVYKDYIASRSPDAKSIEEELEHVSVEEYIASQLTIFMRDPETGVHELHHHMIKGFFKNACKALREKPKSVSSGIAAYKTKIDNLVFVEPSFIKFTNYNPEEVYVFERPLRASTAQGDRVALVASEAIKKGAQIEFEVETFNGLMTDGVREWLDYGKKNGLAQYHNGGYGRFVWEELDKEGNVIGGNKPTNMASL